MEMSELATMQFHMDCYTEEKQMYQIILKISLFYQIIVLNGL